MSTHFVPDDSTVDVLGFLPAGRTLHLQPTPGGVTCEILPDLTPTQAARFAELVAAGRSRIRFTDAEFDALRPDIDGLRTYHGLASPTAAQTAQATKAIIRILRSILRD